MSSSAIERLPTEIVLQICELLQDTHPASTRSFSETSHKIRHIANKVIFRKVLLSIRDHNSVKEEVQRLLDVLGPIFALDHIRTLRLCAPPDPNKRDIRYPYNWHSSDMAPAEVVATYDLAWTPVVALLQRCPALSDLIYELEHQLPPCVLDAVHQFHPHCRLHLRTFCVRSLMGLEPDKHELAPASSPCLHSIWFSYMEPDQDDKYALRSQRVVQQVLTELAPNVEVVRFSRMKHGPRREPEWPPRLPIGRNSSNPSKKVRRLDITSRDTPKLTGRELASWHKHVDFSLLHALTLGSPLERHAQLRLIGYNLSSLKVLTFFPGSSYLGRLFITSLPPLKWLCIKGPWNIHDMKVVYQAHGASLRRLMFFPTKQPAIDITVLLLEEMRDQCPLLEELHIAMLRDQGSPAEVAIYKMLATFPVLRRLDLYFSSKSYRSERHRGRMEHYDSFDQQHSGRYGVLRRALISHAIDENFARNVFYLVSPLDRVRGLDELKVIGLPIETTGRRRIHQRSGEVLYHICRSWKVLRGVRDDRPGEVEIEEMSSDGRPRRPAPKNLDPFLGGFGLDARTEPATGETTGIAFYRSRMIVLLHNLIQSAVSQAAFGNT